MSIDSVFNLFSDSIHYCNPITTHGKYVFCFQCLCSGSCTEVKDSTNTEAGTPSTPCTAALPTSYITYSASHQVAIKMF